jgi:hypothetical protein
MGINYPFSFFLGFKYVSYTSFGDKLVAPSAIAFAFSVPQSLM